MLLLFALQVRVCGMNLCRVSEHIRGQSGLRQSVLNAQRAKVRHPLLALRQAGADGAGAVPARQHAGGRRVRAERLVWEGSRLCQRAGEAEAGDQLKLLLLRLLLQLQL